MVARASLESTTIAARHEKTGADNDHRKVMPLRMLRRDEKARLPTSARLLCARSWPLSRRSSASLIIEMKVKERISVSRVDTSRLAGSATKRRRTDMHPVGGFESRPKCMPAIRRRLIARKAPCKQNLGCTSKRPSSRGRTGITPGSHRGRTGVAPGSHRGHTEITQMTVCSLRRVFPLYDGNEILVVQELSAHMFQAYTYM